MSKINSRQNLLKRTAKLEKELAAKNHELEIEAALEKVRTVAMGMNKPGDLPDVCKTLYKQFLLLGFGEMRNAMVNIHNDADKSFINYDYSDEIGKSTNHLTYNIHPLIEKQIKKIRSANDAFSETYFNGKDLVEWKKFRRRIGEKDDPRLRKNKGLYYYFYSIGTGSIGISTFGPIDKEKKALLKRFRNVFNLSYQRYIDIAKAEAQAKEAEIELALERVRAKTMAMQKSEELQETTLVLFQQFKSLGVTTAQVSICVFDEDTRMGEMFVTLKGEKIDRSFKMDLDKEVFVMRKAKKAFLDKQKKVSFTVKGKELQEYNQWRNSLIGRKGWDESNAVRKRSWHVDGVFFSRGMMGISSEMPASVEAIKLLERFAGVFDLTFTRFLDLQKAEAQAREAQIEAALERVRARTMAMRKSDELPETTFLLFQQLKELGETAAQLSIGIIKEEQGIVELSATVHGSQLLQTYPVPASDAYFMKKVIKPWKAKERFLTVEIRGKELIEYNKWRNSVLKRKIVFPEKQWIINVVFFSKGMISFSSDKHISHETIQLLERFAGVFDLTYTRFLDLQNAEAQAREAHIEAALERVRASSMAMHRSDELDKVIKEVTEQLTVLGFDFDASNITTDPTSAGFYVWNASPAQPIPSGVYIPYKDIDIINWIYSDWAFHEGIKTDTFSKAQKNAFFKHYFTHTDARNISDERKKYILDAKSLIFSFACRKDFALGLLNYRGIIYTEEQNNILARFSKVFEQSYTRFLDLQKAEDQTRESQIQLALERVRARTMAMQKSEELMEAANLLFQQVQSLGIPVWSCGYNIWEKGETVCTAWMSTQGEIQPSFRIPLTEHRTFIRMNESRLKEESFYVEEVSGEELADHYRYMFSLPDFAKTVTKQLQDSFPLPLSQIHHVFNFKHGNLIFLSAEAIPGAWDIFKRFTDVFEQTYIRFLDLQKAEAQARESQIQLALERVRARTMAMQKSDELAEVAILLFKQVSDLGIKTWTTGFNIWSDDNNYYEDWITNPQGGFIEPYTIDATKFPVFIEIADAKKRGEEFFVQYVEGELLEETYRHLSKFGEKQFSELLESGFQFPSRQFDHFVFGSKISLMFISYEPVPEAHDIFKRFGKVFEQTYRRFLDLKNAETQGRQAQIELGLERVRNRAMAMQTSEELNALIGTVFTELTKLDLVLTRCVILIYEGNEKGVRWWMANSEAPSVPMNFFVKYADMPFFNEYLKGWQERSLKWQYILEGENKFNTDEFLFKETELSQLPDFVIAGMRAPGRVYLNASFNNFGNLTLASLEPLSDEHFDILLRFAKVFDLTYTRFNDLQQAEAQAREAQIQLALERVRARTMAMHKSVELAETAQVLFHQLQELGGIPDRIAIGVVDELAGVVNFWSTDQAGSHIDRSFKARLNERKVMAETYQAWKDHKKSLIIDLHGDDVKEWIQFAREEMGVVVKDEFIRDRRVHNFVFFSHGWILVTTHEPQNPEAILILERFASVFNLTYRRFLDLEKAETQAREAQIETSLERVRSKTMAMHSSDDVTSATATMFIELEKLGIENLRCGISVINKNKTMEVWSVSNVDEGKIVKGAGSFDMNAHPVWRNLYEGWQRKEEFQESFLAGKEKEDYVKLLNARPDYLSRPIREFPDMYREAFYFEQGAVWTYSLQPHSEEDRQIMKRFTSVFSLTFRRYQDLKQAEAQAREAQIESSLERVRSKTMAMHSSDDVTSATATMFTELERLGIENMRCGIAYYLEDHKMEVWSVSNLADGKVVRGAGLLDTNSIPFWKIFYSTWQKKEDFLFYYMQGEEKEDYFKKISTVQNYLSQSIENVPDINIQAYYFSEGSVWAFSLKPHTEEDKQVMKRFASVFSLTFRRYQDLKKAEAQAREATIEAALEKVRGKAMAMHNSNDLSVTASLVFTELRKLGISPIRCGVGLLNKESRKAQLYSATVASDGDSLSLVGWVMLSKHPVAEKIYDMWLVNEDYYPELSGDQLRSYYENLLSGLSLPSVPDWGTGQKQFGTFLPFSVGCLYAWSEAPYNETEIKILKRFAAIIDLTFRRYMELQTSEANAREAVKQAALDRIRADIASMRTIADLDRITPLIWSELTILGIPFIRCGVFIMDEAQQLIHTFLSTPEGKAIAAFHIPYDTPGSFADILTHWKNKKTYINHWGEVDMMSMADILVNQGAIATKEQYLRSLPKEGFYLHFLPFLQGMLYVGNLEKLSDEEIELIEHVADAFSTAYARYEDFNKLEAAKQQVEKTLTDLKQAQTQLVQSEKMASLGELTAGIAHEIQNPLNFVNNFSDVSNELLDEMKAELANGNIGDAIAIAEDVKQNLEKINHHGKRADGIVKGMLLHSRTSSGQKEMTDINSLADEYLRLAYHGLRAKDKSFNAKFETDFDKSVGEINIIPQEIGRVILNLINNAFYAVSERKKTPQSASGGGVTYEPTVTLTTVKDNRKIEIKVKDNGNGISQKVLDKIFLPFFTTKPTGQGTGLGLSLAYDIIKAHGGDIRVETKEGEGSEFIVELPVV